MKKNSIPDVEEHIGNLGKVENGIVAVTAYGLLENITFPLTFAVYKPKARLHDEDPYHTKPEIASAMIQALRNLGFEFDLVVADSLYGESGSNFVSVLRKFERLCCKKLLKRE